MNARREDLRLRSEFSHHFGKGGLRIRDADHSHAIGETVQAAVRQQRARAAVLQLRHVAGVAEKGHIACIRILDAVEACDGQRGITADDLAFRDRGELGKREIHGKVEQAEKQNSLL